MNTDERLTHLEKVLKQALVDIHEALLEVRELRAAPGWPYKPLLKTYAANFRREQGLRAIAAQKRLSRKQGRGRRRGTPAIRDGQYEVFKRVYQEIEATTGKGPTLTELGDAMKRETDEHYGLHALRTARNLLRRERTARTPE